MDHDALEVYLNDHLAGAVLGSSLASRVARRHDGEGLGAVMTMLAAEIEEDREVLVTVMGRVGAKRNPVKQATTWMGEQASRPKFGGLGTSDELGTFLALESLVLGVSGKLGLWRVLGHLTADHPGLAGVDYDALQARAAHQRDTLERERLTAADRALVSA